LIDELFVYATLGIHPDFLDAGLIAEGGVLLEAFKAPVITLFGFCLQQQFKAFI
jgi:hypothetical protein